MAGRLKLMGQAKYQTNGNPRTSGPGFGLTCHPQTLSLLATWLKPRMIFVNSMSDLFHEKVPIEFIRDVLDVMRDTQHHIYQILTKRSQRLAQLSDALDWPPNTWVGVSVESARYLFRVEHLWEVSASVRFVSAEPLLGPLGEFNITHIDWLIAGSESGVGARPISPKWVTDLRDHCIASKVPFFFKQWGGRSPKSGGRELDSRTWDEYPLVYANS